MILDWISILRNKKEPLIILKSTLIQTFKGKNYGTTT